MSLRDDLQHLASASGGLPEDQAAFDAAVATIDVPGLAVGAVAPHFELQSASGETWRLDRGLRAGPVVLVFYRGAWCPFCNLTLRAFQTRLQDFRAVGAAIVAISPQAPDAASGVIEDLHIDFPVLSDVSQEVIRAYGLQFTMPEGLQRLYADDYGLDLPSLTADGSWRLPVPGIVVIGRDGRVGAAFVDADYRRRPDPNEVLAAVRRVIQVA